MKKDDLNIMANMKLIEELKASLLCIIGELYSLLVRGSNVAQNAILDCIDENDALAPVECVDGEEYLGRKYILKNIPKEKKHYTIDQETGEITFFDLDDDFSDFDLDDFELDKEDDYEDESTSGIFNVFYDEGI